MSIFDFFFGRKQNENNSRRGVKLNRRAVRTRNLAMEPLETRDLLSVTTGLIDDSAYAELREQYPEFNLPEEQSTLNVMVVDIDEDFSALKLSDLKSALATAETTEESDLILVRTSSIANSVTYASNTDEVSINVDSTLFGSITIIGWGKEKFTLYANQQSRVMTVSGSSTVVNLGGLKITGGNSEASASNTSYGGGISNYSSILTVTNCTILENTSSQYGGGIYNDGTLTVTNSEFSDNTAKYGGGIYIRYRTLSITNSTILSNTASVHGGGIYIDGRSLTVTDCSISGNTASQYGGGFYIYTGTHTVTNSEFSDNTAIGSPYSRGGGICTYSGTLTITNSKIARNAASGSYSNGGGICNIGTNMTITIINSMILDNTASHGGGISNYSGAFTVINSTISGNEAISTAGGGIYVNSGTLTATNSIISENAAYSDGGGININTGTFTATNCTISGNTATSGSGGGIYNSNATTLYNSIVACNTASIFGKDIYKSNGSINAYNSLSSYKSWDAGNRNITYDSGLPLFIDAEKNDYHLAIDSQAIDKGNNQYAVDGDGQALTVDLANIPRIQGESIDIGSYEFDMRNLLAVPEFTLATNTSSIIVTIAGVENATGYQIEYDLNEDFSDSDIIDAQAGENALNDIIFGQTYYVRVQAVGDEVYIDSEFSGSQSVTIIPVPPATPVIEVIVNGSDSIMAIVSESDDAVGYRLQYSTDDTFAKSTIADVDAGQNIIRGLLPNTVYYFRAYTYGATDLHSDFSNVESITISPIIITPLNAPSDLTLSAEDTAVTATWSTVTNASSYTVLYQIDGADGWTTITGIQGLTTSFVGIPGAKYNVKVQANGTGNYSDSEFSATTSITLPVPPTQLTGLTLSNYAPEVGTTIIASLDQTDATASYQWYCGTAIINGATASSFTVTEYQIGQTITCVATGTGDYTGTVSATTAAVPLLPLGTPSTPTLSAEDTTVTATWSTVTNASSYTVLYQIDGADGWTTITGIQGLTTSFVGIPGAKYNVKVQANGTGNYSDSEFSAATSITLAVPPTQLTGLTLSNYAPEVGTTIIATLVQTGATADYQWYCGETAITGETNSSFAVTESQIGQTITCVATGTGNYTGTASATTSVVPAFELDSPVLSPLNTVGSIVIAAWSEVDDADGYTLEYKPEDSQKWTSISGLDNTTVAFVGSAGTTYNVRVKSNGTGIYSDSSYSAIESITLSVPLTGLTLSTSAPEVGTTITTTLTPSDATAEYQWYSGETEIDSATASSFTVTKEQIGQTITCVAIGAEGYIGTASATTAVVPALTLESPSIPELTLNGTTVNAAWSAVDDASGYTLEYQADGSESWSVITGISGTDASFNGVAGTTYNVRIKANGTSYYTDSEYSESTSIYIPIPLTGIMLSTNAPEVGTTITTTLSPSDATANYQWFSGETLIEGENTSSFIVTESQIGQTITCVATGTGDYTGTVSITTAVIPVPVVPLEAPTDFALSAEDATITASWKAVDNASSYTLLYQIDGTEGWTAVTDIQSTTTSIVGIAGTTYNVKVQANGTGNYSDSEYSDELSIKLNIPLTGITLSTDSPIVGTTITATLTPSDATATYQWYSGETLIENATGASFVVTEAQINQTITCVATGTGYYTGTASATTSVVPVPVVALDAPADVALSVYNATITASWSAVENASSYTLEYKPVGAENWTALPGLEDTAASFVGVSGTMYNVRVKAVGTGGYSDSSYAEINTDKPTGPVVAINANKVTVSWVDDSPAADSVRYRVAGTTRWTTKKLKAGITSLTFNATIGANYDIEVLLDQQENNVLQGTAIVLDQPRLTSIRNELKDDTFQVNVTNYAAKNLAANVKQAIVSVNGAMTTLKIADQQGETALANGGKVAFSNGLFTFSEMNSNTSYKVTISFSDGHSVSKTSTALTVKTLKAPYLPPVITSAVAVSDTSIEVAWETAYGKNSTTPAQKYTVQYSTDGAKWTNATTGATGNSYTIQRLKGGVEYQVRVLATKDAAFEASAPSGVLSSQTLTLPKTVLDKASIKDDTFKLDVTNYATSNLVNAPTLNVKSDKFGEAAIAIQNGSGSATFENGMVAAFENGAVTFTNVPSNTQQKIQVNFSAGVCTTAWTAALTVKTTIAPYNKPVLTNATATSSTTVLVEWDAVTGKNSTVLAPSYTVQYTTDGTRWTNANTRVVGTSFTIPNLKPNTSYRVAVIANKDAQFNASEPSESLLVTTLN